MVNLNKYEYYIIIETKEDKISLFNLYDDENKILYNGEDKIVDSYMKIKSDFKTYFNMEHLIIIPIKIAQFKQMLNFCYQQKVNNKKFQKFIKDHNLIEWSI
jgi:hypothetical protein